jgi:hypothetical protein
MKKVQQKPIEPIKSENIKGQPHPNGKGKVLHGMKTPADTNISDAAKNLNADSQISAGPGPSSDEATHAATKIAKGLSSLPTLPIAIPVKNKDVKKLEEKILDKLPPKFSFIKKPAVIFIEGFSAFGISNGDGIRDMADNLPGAKKFSWDDQDKIIEEIKKHSPEQPVVLVGHSFGGDSAIEVANALNSVKNGFRGIDLLISIDSVGMNHSIIPMNVKRNLNFFGEGVVPFLHGDPNVARNTGYSEVVNELRSELHSKMEDSEEVQFKIFESINEVLSENNQPDIFIEMQKDDQLRLIIDSQMLRHLKD